MHVHESNTHERRFWSKYDDKFLQRPDIGHNSETTESHQYEQDESEVWWHHQLQRHFEDKGRWWTFARKTDLLRWCLTLVTGFCCALVALLVTSFTKLLTFHKYKLFQSLIIQEKAGKAIFGTAFFFLYLCNLIFACIAWCAVHYEPLAGGSGIAEIKCYLNGLNIPRLVNPRTLLCKAVGIVFACAAGLPLGKEGPMVHIGSIIAASVSQGTFCGANFSKYQDLRNDKEKRDFVACGAAAGVSAAFGAPIGGVLFALEEGASFWSTKLTWRCFFCAMATVFFLYAFATAGTRFGHSDSTAMFNFGEFFSLQGEISNYSVWELLMFLLLGCFGGLVGAQFNRYAELIYNFRSRIGLTYSPRGQNSSFKRFAEVIFLVSLMSSVSMVLPLFWNKCTPLPEDMEGWSEQEKSLVVSLQPLYCDSETEYHELASLYLTDSDTAIRQLFHFREIGDHNDATFSSAALFLFFVPYLSLACMVYGSAVPAGMFVPSLLSGAALGRLFGHVLHRLDNARGTFADSGTYALMGAAALTSGIARMTISLTIMILEATGDMQYVLPLMLTVLSARVVGNIFTEGIYDIHIKQRQLRFLDEDEGEASVTLHDLVVGDIMTQSPISFFPIMRVGTVYEILCRGRHHCYPVTDEEGVLLGVVPRRSVCMLLKLKAFSLGDVSPLVNWGALEHVYPAYPDIEQIILSDSERGYLLDLGPYMDSSPYIITEQASLTRTHRMFRTLGLRHLVVVSRKHTVLGIVTRSDLVAAHRISHIPSQAHGAGKRAGNDSNQSEVRVDDNKQEGGKERRERYIVPTINLRS